MGRREVADLEAKLFDVEKKGCLAVMTGPRKRAEIDYELHQDGGARMKIGLKDAPVPEGTSQVTVSINDAAVANLDIPEGSGYLRLDSGRGDALPEVVVGDVAKVRAGGRVACSGTFHRD
jgi:hypothetical protein